MPDRAFRSLQMLVDLRRLWSILRRLDAVCSRSAARILAPPGRNPGFVARTLVRLLALGAATQWRWLAFAPIRAARVAEQGVLLREGPGISLAPRFAFEPRRDADVRHVRARFPDVCYRRFADAIVDAHSSSVLLGATHFLPDHAFELLSTSRVKGASLLHQGASIALHTFARDLPVVEQAVHLGGYHAFNWYHWIAETLPRAMLLSDLPAHLQGFPLIVPAAAARPGTLREAVEAMCPGREIVSFPAQGTLRVQDLIVIDDLILHPSGFGPGGGPRTERELIHVEGMSRYRRALRSALEAPDGIEPGLRIFIDRDHDPERSYNREALLRIARERGFISIVGANLGLAEQARLFARAEIIIGPNGAGWTNVLFCSPGARGLCWIVPEGAGGPWFRNLGHIAGVELSYLEAEPRGEGNPLKIDYHVDEERFTAALEEVIQGW
jgi:capsular polysaccharide biosynthesis protein